MALTEILCRGTKGARRARHHARRPAPRAARSAPDRLALIAGVPDPALRRQWTYAELHAEAERTARALLGRFKPGERIAVWAQICRNGSCSNSARPWPAMALVTVNPGFRSRKSNMC